MDIVAAGMQGGIQRKLRSFREIKAIRAPAHRVRGDIENPGQRILRRLGNFIWIQADRNRSRTRESIPDLFGIFFAYRFFQI